MIGTSPVIAVTHHCRIIWDITPHPTYQGYPENRVLRSTKYYVERDHNDVSQQQHRIPKTKESVSLSNGLLIYLLHHILAHKRAH